MIEHIIVYHFMECLKSYELEPHTKLQHYVVNFTCIIILSAVVALMNGRVGQLAIL